MHHEIETLLLTFEHAFDPVLLDGGDGVQVLQLRLCECTACLGVGHETEDGEREEC